MYGHMDTAPVRYRVDSPLHQKTGLTLRLQTSRESQVTSGDASRLQGACVIGIAGANKWTEVEKLVVELRVEDRSRPACLVTN